MDTYKTLKEVKPKGVFKLVPVHRDPPTYLRYNIVAFESAVYREANEEYRLIKGDPVERLEYALGDVIYHKHPILADLAKAATDTLKEHGVTYVPNREDGITYGGITIRRPVVRNGRLTPA